MHRSDTIATCCYCGNQTTLALTGKNRHELACSSCGAPLRRMKSLKVHKHDRAPHPAELAGHPHRVRDYGYKKPKKHKKKKGKAARFFDIAEDIFDIFD